MANDTVPFDSSDANPQVPDIFRGTVDRRGRPSRVAIDAVAADADDRLDLSGLISIFRRRLLLFGAIVALCTLMAFLVTLRMPPQFTATADIALQPGGDTITPGSTESDDQPQRAEQIESELQFMRSRYLAAKVFDRLGLARDRAFAEQIGNHGSRPFRDAAVNAMIASLDAKRIGTAYALRVSYVDQSPDRAARIANGYAQLYADERVANLVAENSTAIRVLQSRMEELRTQAQTDFGALQRYRIRNNLQTKSGTALTEQEVSSYNQQVATARAVAAEDASRLSAARAQNRQSFDEVGVTASSPAFNALRTQRALISARLTEVSSKYGEKHPEVTVAREQLEDIDKQIALEVRRSILALESEARASNEKLGSLAASLNRANTTLTASNAALVAMDDLERRAQTSQDLYESYLNRYKEAVARAGAEQPKSSVLSPALVPLNPSSPNLPLNLLLGLLVGGLLGATSAIVAENGFAGLTTGNDVEKRIGVRYLGALPLAESVEPRSATLQQTIVDHPGSVLAESVRGLLTSLRQASNGRNQVIAVTSALPGEGKSTVSAAMAQIAHAAGQRVILIDCDVIRHNLSSLYGPGAGSPGLRECLIDGLEPEKAAITLFGGSVLLPITTPFEKGERLLQDGKLHRLIAKLRESYDLIVLDCAPVLPIAETREIVALADNVMMVTRWRATSERALRAAVRLLPLGSINDLGAMLNGVDMRKRMRFGGGDSDVFYKSYQSYYRD